MASNPIVKLDQRSIELGDHTQCVGVHLPARRHRVKIGLTARARYRQLVAGCGPSGTWLPERFDRPHRGPRMLRSSAKVERQDSCPSCERLLLADRRRPRTAASWMWNAKNPGWSWGSFGARRWAGMGRNPVYTNVGSTVAQLDRQVSGNGFSGLVGRTRPAAALGGAAPGVVNADVTRPSSLSCQRAQRAANTFIQRASSGFAFLRIF